MDIESAGMEVVPLSTEHADAVHQLQATIAGLQATIEILRALDHLRGVQRMEAE